MAEEQNFCVICQEDIFISCMNGGCLHKYCFQCFFKWTKNRRRSGYSPRCPVCNAEYTHIYLPIDSESLLNTIERIVYGQNRSHIPLNQYLLRRLIYSPHWNNLDQFWSRMHLVGVIEFHRIYLVVIIDSRADITVPFLKVAKLDELDLNGIDALLRSHVNHVFFMAIIICSRHENV